MKKICLYRSSTIDILSSSRSCFVKIRDDSSAIKSKDETMGINYNIILNTACILEGELEEILFKLIYFYQKKYMKVNIEEFELSRLINSFLIVWLLI